MDYSWIQDLGVEFIINPNADFQPNRDFVTGNDRGGVWQPDQNSPFGKVGSFIITREEPDEWDPDTWEFGLKIKAMMNGAIVTLNYFYGIDNDPTLYWQRDPMAPPPGTPGFPPTGIPWITPPVLFGAPPELVDGQPVIHPHIVETFNRFRFAGFTFSKDIISLTSPGWLGGVAPVLRIEAMYVFDYTVYDEDSVSLTDEVDEIRYMVGFDWKVRVNWLNPRSYFYINYQFFHRHELDYPDWQIRLLHEAGRIDRNNYTSLLILNTRYLHEKLTPTFIWWSDWTKDAEMFKIQLSYEPNSTWQYTLGTLLFSGQEPDELFEAFGNKDQVYFTVGYRF